MAIVNIKGVKIIINGVDPGTPEFQQLVTTLKLLPFNHLIHIPTIAVGSQPPRGGGGSASRTMRGGPYIRLNRTCFRSEWNRGAHNYTLLHEIGHIIDWEFGAMASLHTTNPDGHRALMDHHHSGATQSPGEHYADGYADYFAHGPERLRRRDPDRLDVVLGSVPFRVGVK
jgi:hypothetical protein